MAIHPIPQYIYKIVPSSQPPPSPLPTALPLSPLDSGDGFIHLSTSLQLLGTLRNFFKNEASVYIMRILYEDIKEFVKWENVHGREGEASEEGFFPHVYGNAEGGGLKLGSKEVESVGIWKKGDKGWTGEEWCFEDDVPV